MEFFSTASGRVEPLYFRHLSVLMKGVGSFQINMQVVQVLNIEVSSFQEVTVYRGVFISFRSCIRGMHFRGLK